MRLSNYETDPTGKRVWNFDTTDWSGWDPNKHGQGDFNQFEDGVRALVREIKGSDGDLNGENTVFAMVMEMIANKPPGMVDRATIIQAINNALQFVQEAQIVTDGSPDIYQKDFTDAPRFNELGERGFAELPKGMTDQIPGWGRFPGYVGDPHYPARVRWTHTVEASKIEWLMNRPDKFKETPQGQQYLQWMVANPQYDHLFPWMWSQARKGQIHVNDQGQPHLTTEGGGSNLAGIQGYWQGYEQEYGMPPHGFSQFSSPEALHDTVTFPHLLPDSDRWKADAARQLLQKDHRLDDVSYRMWDKDFTPHALPVASDQLDRWAAFAKDKNHPVRQEAGNIDRVDANEFSELADKWHFQKTNGKVIHNYNNGWTMRQLETPEELEYEGDEMGHCVGGHGYGNAVNSGQALIYSLRDKQNRPHTTMEITPLDNGSGRNQQVDLARVEEIMDPKTEKEFWDSYGMNPEMVANINEGIADGEEWPYPSQDVYMQFKSLVRAFPGELAPVHPHGGTVKQIQGKSDEPPIEKYQKMVKHYFRNNFSYDSTPSWEDGYADDMDSLRAAISGGDEYGNVTYHPGDYGLPDRHVEVEWDSVINNVIQGNYYGDIDGDDVELIGQTAVDQGSAKEVETLAQYKMDAAREEVRDELERETRWNRGMLEEDFAYGTPRPDEQDFYDEEGNFEAEKFDQAEDKWRDEFDEHVDHWREEQEEEKLSNHPASRFCDELEDAINRAERQKRVKANPWYEPMRKTMTIDGQKAGFDTEEARKMIMEAKEKGTVKQLKDALFNWPQHMWEAGHHALMYHLKHELEN